MSGKGRLSWLNMAEVEFSVLAWTCLRIGTRLRE